MAQMNANPDNLPCAEYEEFDLSEESSAQHSVHSELKRVYGQLKEILAHSNYAYLNVTYSKIREIEILSGKRSAADEKKTEDRFAVSFKAKYKLHDLKGKAMSASRVKDVEWTRITYWNFAAKDFYHLCFLRDTKDKLLFIDACEKAAFLFRIAAENLDKDAPLAHAASERGIRLLHGMKNLDDAAMAECLTYLAALMEKNRTAADTLIATIRRIDRCGEFGDDLVRLLSKHGYAVNTMEKILADSMVRLLKKKPRHYSLKLYNIFDFVFREDFATPSAEDLLWQTYLAAAAEREIRVLKYIWVRAVRMKADRETLEMIYKTWRGFSQPRRAIDPMADDFKEKNAASQDPRFPASQKTAGFLQSVQP